VPRCTELQRLSLFDNSTKHTAVTGWPVALRAQLTEPWLLSCVNRQRIILRREARTVVFQRGIARQSKSDAAKFAAGLGEYFSPDYFTAKRRFLDACDRLAFEHHSRSLAYYDEGRWYEALRESRLARKADASYLAAASRTADLYHAVGDDEHALVEYQSLLESQPAELVPEDVYYRAGILMHETFGRRDESIKFMMRVLDRYPAELKPFDVSKPSTLFRSWDDFGGLAGIRAAGQQWQTFLRTLERLARWHLQQGNELEAAKYYSAHVDFLWRHGFPFGIPRHAGLTARVNRDYRPLYWKLVCRNQDAKLRPPMSLRVLEPDETYGPSTQPSHGFAKADQDFWLCPPGQEIAAVEYSAEPPVGKMASRRDDGKIQFDFQAGPGPLILQEFKMVDPNGSTNVWNPKPGLRMLQTHVFHTDRWRLKVKLRPWSKQDLSATNVDRRPNIFTIPADATITIGGRVAFQGVNNVDDGKHVVVARWPNGKQRSAQIVVKARRPADRSSNISHAANHGQGPSIILNSKCRELSRAVLDSEGSHPCLLRDHRGRYWMLWDGQRANAQEQPDSDESDLYIATSLDGAHWTPRRRLPVSTSDRDMQPRLQQDNRGNFWLVWQVVGDNRKELVISRSPNGSEWTFPRKINVPQTGNQDDERWRESGYGCGFAIDTSGTFWLLRQGWLMRSSDSHRWTAVSLSQTSNSGVADNWHGAKQFFLESCGRDELVLATSGALWKRSRGAWRKTGTLSTLELIQSDTGAAAADPDGNVATVTETNTGIEMRDFDAGDGAGEPLLVVTHHFLPATPAVLRLPDHKRLVAYVGTEGVVALLVRKDNGESSNDTLNN